MKKLLMSLGLILTLATVSVSAFATQGSNHYGHKSTSYSSKHVVTKKVSWLNWIKKVVKKHKAKSSHKNVKTPKHQSPHVTSVPEIDGGHAGLVFALLASVYGIMRERKLKVVKS